MGHRFATGGPARVRARGRKPRPLHGRPGRSNCFIAFVPVQPLL